MQNLSFQMLQTKGMRAKISNGVYLGKELPGRIGEEKIWNPTFPIPYVRIELHQFPLYPIWNSRDTTAQTKARRLSKAICMNVFDSN